MVKFKEHFVPNGELLGWWLLTKQVKGLFLLSMVPFSIQASIH